ncbi:MAG: cyclodeaminase/cyclohydrolase family protein [Candidatus Omnitrophota bacterium]
MKKKRRYLECSLDDYLKELSGRSIVPGGGSVSALTAALGAGLNLMVLNYSIGKKRNAGRGDIIAARKKQRRSLGKLSGLVDRDCKAFSALMKALSVGRNAQGRYKTAAAVPMDICRECHVSMDITAFLLKKGNKNLVTDVGCAADILKAAFDSALLNVKVNLREISDRRFVKKTEKALAVLKKGIGGHYAKISREVEKVMGKRAAR